VEYNMTRISDTAGAAVFPSDPGAIRVYFDVDDINAGAAKLREAGGEADDPQPVPSMGWFVSGRTPKATRSVSGRTTRRRPRRRARASRYRLQ